jgi:uncharacterized membrane protein YraQ (UPF0718 family)
MAVGALQSGFTGVLDYLSAHVLTCLLPAFMIAGAIAVFVRKDTVLRYFGKDVPRHISYPVASVSGTILAVCSCTILPLFAGIYRRGSGIGPASAFLYSGPAINILAVVYTARILGPDLGLARAAGAVALAILIGLFMARVFRKDEADKETTGPSRVRPHPNDEDGSPSPFPLMGLLLAILVLGTWNVRLLPKLSGILILVAITVLYVIRVYSIHELRAWVTESWDLARKIFPALILGTFVVGFVSFYLPPETFRDYLGGNALPACFLGAVIGGILYMPTLLEVPIIGTTFGYSSGFMGFGPALSLLLAGPAVSLPSMIVLYRVVGIKKTAAYISMVVLLSALAGYVLGMSLS